MPPPLQLPLRSGGGAGHGSPASFLSDRLLAYWNRTRLPSLCIILMRDILPSAAAASSS